MANIPSVGVLIAPNESSLCKLHLLIFRQGEEILRESKDIFVLERQGKISEVGKATGGEDIMELLCKVEYLWRRGHCFRVEIL